MDSVVLSVYYSLPMRGYFRPALVNNVRKGSQVSVEFDNAFATPVIRRVP